MNLHENAKLFSETLRAASQHLGINLEFVEKDYWITLVLSLLSNSKYASSSVFKGGTSLSKGYQLIERFSEDVDLAIINDNNKTGNAIKTIIRTIEKEITNDLTEIQIDGVSSKGSKFRKSVFEYISADIANTNNKLIVEINSFANPFPFQPQTIQSMIFDFLVDTGNEKYIEQYNLHSFEVNVLSKEQTLLEKMVSLIRFSFGENPIESISGKIRHFYDLYFLSKHPECVKLIESDSFKDKFNTILNHDRAVFEEPKAWENKLVSESPLINDFESVWKQLKGKYQSELSALAYRPIPDEEIIANSFIALIKRIE